MPAIDTLISTLALPPPVAGLTSAKVRRLLDSGGANAVADVAQHAAQRVLLKLWATVPWMLQSAILLQLCIGKYAEAEVVALLPVTNVVLGFFQEDQVQTTLRVSKSRLALSAAVRCGGTWTTTPAASVVLGDVFKLSLGSLVPANVRQDAVSVLVGQSVLTDESLTVAAAVGAQALAR